MLIRKYGAVFLCMVASGPALQPYLYAEDLYSQSNKWLQTEHFAFKIPSPWNYAIPKSDGKNQARCFLQSKLQLFAKGLFLVDVGHPKDSIQDTLSALMERMVPPGKVITDIEIKHREVKLDGVTALALLSDQTIAKTPCMVIVCFNNEKQKLFLFFSSVSTEDGLQHRDAMLESLEKTWRWR